MWDWLKKLFGGGEQEEQPTQPVENAEQSMPENTEGNTEGNTEDTPKEQS